MVAGCREVMKRCRVCRRDVEVMEALRDVVGVCVNGLGGCWGDRGIWCEVTGV